MPRKPRQSADSVIQDVAALVKIVRRVTGNGALSEAQRRAICDHLNAATKLLLDTTSGEATPPAS
jgi:hypothetical protein